MGIVRASHYSCNNAVPQFQQRAHVPRIEDLRAPAERAGVLRDHLRADSDRHPVVIQLHPHGPVGVADRHRIRLMVHPHMPEFVGHPRDDAARGGKVSGPTIRGRSSRRRWRMWCRTRLRRPTSARTCSSAAGT